jgi:hypothetical protein
MARIQAAKGVGAAQGAGSAAVLRKEAQAAQLVEDHRLADWAAVRVLGLVLRLRPHP